jgi:predicted nucleic acid-binding protein
MMQVLVDTCIWSLALRRQAMHLSADQSLLRDELFDLAQDGRAQCIGPIRQEILSGIREASQFERLRQALRAFSDEPLTTSDYEIAAKLGNRCRAARVAGSSIDFLLCAVATERNWPIFTVDEDFRRYSTIIPIKLHLPNDSNVPTP